MSLTSFIKIGWICLTATTIPSHLASRILPFAPLPIWLPLQMLSITQSRKAGGKSSWLPAICNWVLFCYKARIGLLGGAEVHSTCIKNTAITIKVLLSRVSTKHDLHAWIMKANTIPYKWSCEWLTEVLWCKVCSRCQSLIALV